MAIATETSAVVGVFEQRDDAERALHELREAGFSDEIGFIVHEDIRDDETELAEEAGEAALKGAALGGALGGAFGVAALLLPGIGPVIAGGVLANVLGGALAGGTGGALAGGFLGAMTVAGMSDEEANLYERELKAGRAMILVRTEHRRDEAEDILRKHGGYDVRTSVSSEEAQEEPYLV